MRKLVLQMGVSLDGMVARHGRFGGGGWGTPPEDHDLKARKLAWMREDADLHLMGRATYEEMAGFWPTSDDEYAAPMNKYPKVVFSKTLTEATWPTTTIASGDLADEIAALKSQPGKDMIAWGGAAFAQSLSKFRLIDEYRLVIQPVALGDGLPLFAGFTTPLNLDLIDGERVSGGILDDEAPRVDAQGAQQVPRLAQPREDERAAVRQPLVQPGGHRQPVQAWHVDIKHRHIGPRLLGDFKHLVAAIEFRDHLDVGLHGQQGDQGTPDQVLVFGDEDPDAVQGDSREAATGRNRT